MLLSQNPSIDAPTRVPALPFLSSPHQTAGAQVVYGTVRCSVVYTAPTQEQTQHQVPAPHRKWRQTRKLETPRPDAMANLPHVAARHILLFSVVSTAVVRRGAPLRAHTESHSHYYFCRATAAACTHDGRREIMRGRRKSGPSARTRFEGRLASPEGIHPSQLPGPRIVVDPRACNCRHVIGGRVSHA